VRFSVVAILVTILLAGCKGGSNGTSSTSLDPPAVPDSAGQAPAFPFVDHVDQQNIAAGFIVFLELFLLGDELFEAQYNAFDGIGVLALPDGTPFPQRFSRVPPGGGRFTGPNGQACAACHNSPFPTSAGEAASNVVQDPALAGLPPFNFRNATSLFGSGVVQRLAEEITEDLQSIRDDAAAAAFPGGAPVVMPLVSKGIGFGNITAMRDALGVVTFDTSGVEGVDVDLVVRPYGWKGNVTTLRDFVRGAASNELGMQPSELVAKDPSGIADLDADGVEDEFSIGDITAMTIYVAAQEIPTTLGDLVARGIEPPPTAEVAQAIARGATLFGTIGCADCHIPSLRVLDPVFEEPTRRGGGAYLDPDIDPVATGFDPDRPARFHLVREGDLPRLVPHAAGGAIVSLFGDLKRHTMGAQLADAQATGVSDASGGTLSIGGADVEVPEAVFLTAELWGVGNTGPWLHDGRAGTLEEAILLHGVGAPPAIGDPTRSEAQDARDAFDVLSDADKVAVVEFLESLLLFAAEEED
jgi:cytochrome c peroxidase